MLKKSFILAMIVFFLASCTPNSPSVTQSYVPHNVSSYPEPPKPQETLDQVNWCIIASPLYLHEEDKIAFNDILEEVNKRLAYAGLELNVTIRNDALSQEDTGSNLVNVRSPIVMDDDEKWDLITLSTELAPLVELAQEGAFRDITQDVEEYKGLLTALDERQVDAAKINGKLYYIPTALNYMNNNEASRLLFREDLLDELDVTLVTTDDLITTVKQAMQKWLSCSIVLYEYGLSEIQRGYTQFPFFLDSNKLFYYDSEGHVDAYVKSEIFARDVQLIKELTEITYGGITYASLTAIEKIGMSANPLFCTGYAYDFYADSENWEIITLNPELPLVARWGHGGAYITYIPKEMDSGKGLRLLNWIYSEIANYELMVYGIENKHFTRDVDGAIDRPHTRLYSFEPFISQSKLLFGDRPLSPFESEGNYFDEMPWDRFVFNPVNVANQYQECLELVYGIPLSKIDHYASLDVARVVEQFEEAGIDDLVAECKRQYDAFLKAKGWEKPTP